MTIQAPKYVESAPDSAQDLAALAARGMLFSHWAATFADRTALLSPRGNRSYAELNGNANRLLDHFRSVGLQAGDGVALLCGNIPQFIETYLACQRGGLRLTPINWHLTARESAYILSDCAAKAWVVQGEYLPLTVEAPTAGLLTRLTTGTAQSGFASYARTLDAHNPENPQDTAAGIIMLYTSGTTGQPKGVLRKNPVILMPQRGSGIYNYQDGDLQILSGPAYHGGPLSFDIAIPIASGIPILMMEKFDAAQWLALVSQYRVTHAHMVSTMFRRLLALPEAVRASANLSSLKLIFHGAAPTAPDTKRAMIDWVGPILYEYYGATEASPGIAISSADWLRKPGSVGPVPPTSQLCILDDQGVPCPAGTIGHVHFPYDPASSPSYFNAPTKNAETFGKSHFSIGDLGYIDAENYLFLTGRTAEVIISGGVNIYPQEVDDALISHPAVRDICTIGVPNDDWGEEVKTIITLVDGLSPSPQLASDLLAYARAHLPTFKCPRTIEFTEHIPQSEAGKVLRDQVRRRYWTDQTSQI